MKKIALLLIVAAVALSSCELESPNIEIDHVHMNKNTFYEGSYQMVNWQWVYVENAFNYYDVDVSYSNTGDFTAYDVMIDVHLYLTDGRTITHTHHVGDIDADDSFTIHQTEMFVNTEIRDYFVEAFWSD